jgi:hypothetical protein
MQDVAAAIDETMGELVEVTPIDSAATKPNFSAVMRPDKAVRAIAVFTSTPTHVFGKPSGGKYAGSYEVAPLITTSKPVFSFAYGALPFPLRQHCRIERCCSGELFEITDIQPDGVSRIACTVVRLGLEPEQL